MPESVLPWRRSAVTFVTDSSEGWRLVLFFSPSASAQLATRRRRAVAQRAQEPSMEWGRGGVFSPSERLRAVKSPWGDGASKASPM